VALATDLAEIIGGAIALHILFGLPLILGGIITAIASLVILAVQSRSGQRRFEAIIIGLLVVITIGFMAGLVISPVDWQATTEGLVPRFTDSGSVPLAASLLGAPVRPHAIYLHTTMSRSQYASADNATRMRDLLGANRWDVVFALFVAGSVNIGMLLMAASSLRGQEGTETIEGAYQAISSNLGPVVGIIFAVGLLASGLASTSVGAYAGVSIMEGLAKIKPPIVVVRLITLVPALIVLAAGVDPTYSLVISQVLLSVGIPFALIPLVKLTSSRALMGRYANHLILKIVGWVVAVAIIALNLVLIYLTVVGI
jgi:manganese transport protein